MNETRPSSGGDITEYTAGGRAITVTVRGGKVSGTSELKVVRK